MNLVRGSKCDQNQQRWFRKYLMMLGEHLSAAKGILHETPEAVRSRVVGSLLMGHSHGVWQTNKCRHSTIAVCDQNQLRWFRKYLMMLEEHLSTTDLKSNQQKVSKI